MVLSVVTSVMDFPPTGRVHVAFISVQLLKSIWEFHGVNLVIKDSNLSKTQLMLRSVEGLSTERGSALIKNSTFGQMKIQSEYKVQMVNCQIDGAMRLEGTMLDIKFCDLEIKNCKFFLNKAGLRQPAVLEAIGSRVRVQDSSFNWNIGHHGIIEILQGSQLFITNSEFENNGIFLYSLSLIVVRTNSSAILSNCYFANSVAACGLVCSFPTTSILVQNSTFSNNTGTRGSSINCHNKINMTTVPKNYFNSNNNKEAENDHSLERTWELEEFNSKPILETVSAKDTAKCIVKEIVIKNSFSADGNLYVQGRSVEISDSNFTTNVGGLFGGALKGSEGAIIKIFNCRLVNNQAMTGSFISIEDSTVLDIRNSIIHYNDPTHITASSIHARNYSVVTISKTDFRNQFLVDAIAFHLEKYSKLFVTGSSFNSYYGRGSSVLLATDNIQATFNNCTFNTSCGVSASDNAFVSITSSLLTRCHHVTSGNLMNFQFGSHLYLSETTVTNTKVGYYSTAIGVYFGSSATLVSCYYSDNYLWVHALVENGKLYISNSQFLSNDIISGWLTGSMFIATGSEISITGSVFRNNVHPWTIRVNPNNLFSLTLSNMNVSDCVFEENEADGLVLMESFPVVHQQYIQIINSTFSSNAGDLELNDAADIIIQNSTFHSVMITVVNPAAVRIAQSNFSFAGRQLYFQQYRFLKQSTQLKTLDSNFSNGRYSVLSSEAQFLEKAEKMGVVRVDFAVAVQQEETAFASSEYNIADWFMQLYLYRGISFLQMRSIKIQQ